MRIVYLAHSDASGPSSRYRVHQFRRAFAAADVELVVLPAFDAAYYRAEARAGLPRLVTRTAAQARALTRRLSQLVTLGAADGLVVEREVFPYLPSWPERWLARRPRGFALELDDAVYLSGGRRRKYPTLLRSARAVIVGNETLAAHARRLNDDVVVVPTVVDVARYAPKQVYASARPARIGWVGLPSNFPHLARLAGALRSACAGGRAELVVVSSRAPDLDVPLSFVPWSEEREGEVIASFDVGVMPLDDTPFARGKCGLKLLQYMAAGVPSVASPVGVNATIVRDGANGLLARDDGEWAAALMTLLGEESLRERLGRAGRATVEREYSLEVWGPRVVAEYRRIFAAR